MNFKTFFRNIDRYNPEKIVFVGLGNVLRSDDAAGLIFLNKLQKKKRFESSTFVSAETNPENHIGEVLRAEPELIVFIDTFVSDDTSGYISWLHSDKIKISDFSTHAFSIKLIEQFIRNEFKNCEIRYIGIRPLSLAWGNFLSKDLQRSIDRFFRN